MDVDELKRFENEARAMEGWQLEYSPVVIGEALPWDYEVLGAELLGHANNALDLGTGGGEVFARMLAGSQCQAVAAEAWHPNMTIAADRLSGRALVVGYATRLLPFANESFDLVLARHEAIEPDEIDRVLKPVGTFLTQQVAHNFMQELREYFPESVVFDDFMAQYRNAFQQLGLEITQTARARHKIRFSDLGHLVYQLTAAPWTIPGFSVDSHRTGLGALDAVYQQGEGPSFTAGYDLLQVFKPR